MGEASRRTVLRSGAGLAAAGLAGMTPAHIATADTRTSRGTWTRRFTGRAHAGLDQWAYVPFEVAPGAARISVHAGYEEFSVPLLGSNVLDLGLFGPAGWEPGNATGFRGWSGGARREFTVSASDATPGYLAGAPEPGTWAVALGPIVIHPLGMAWELTVRVEYADPGPASEPAPAPVAVPGPGAGWYRGDLHLHTVYSDGQRTPSEMLAAARDAGLDFIASTEHNTTSANHAWGRYVPDDFLVVAGEEVTTRHGHWLALGVPWQRWIDWRYGPADAGAFPGYAAEVRRAGGIVAAAHPAVPAPGSRWEFGFAEVDAIEVWNGAWDISDEAALGMWHNELRAGRRITALGNSDSHRPDQPVGLPQTVVHAERLSTASIIGALRRGRAYLAESAEVSVELRAWVGDRTAGVGDTLSVATGQRVSCAARVTGAPGAVVVLHGARGPLAAAHTDASGTGVLEWRGGPVEHFLRVEVRRAAFTQLVALSNPIWLVRSELTAG